MFHLLLKDFVFSKHPKKLRNYKVLEQKLALAEKEQEEAHRELTRAQYELETAQSQQRQAEDAVLKLEGQQDHYEILLTALQTNCETLEKELAAIEFSIKKEFKKY